MNEGEYFKSDSGLRGLQQISGGKQNEYYGPRVIEIPGCTVTE